MTASESEARIWKFGPRYFAWIQIIGGSITNSGGGWALADVSCWEVRRSEVHLWHVSRDLLTNALFNLQKSIQYSGLPYWCGFERGVQPRDWSLKVTCRGRHSRIFIFNCSPSPSTSAPTPHCQSGNFTQHNNMHLPASTRFSTRSLTSKCYFHQITSDFPIHQLIYCAGYNRI